jgi:hypothetical protein
MSTSTYNQTFVVNQDLIVPDNARDVFVDMAGGYGGLGGNGGGGRGFSRRGRFSITGNYTQRTLKLRPGGKGTNGSTPTPGNGGGGVASGGNGGSGFYTFTYNCTYSASICTCPVCCGKPCTNSPPCAGGYTPGNGCAEGGLRWFCPQTCTGSGNAGGGGGGGGASVLYIGNTIAAVCGGGGGGRGGPGGGDGANTSNFGTGSITALSNGQNGGSGGSNGGYGGGGGSALGTAKAYNQATTSRYDTSLVSLATNYGLSSNASTGGAGYINVQWTNVVPEIISFESNYSSLIIGGNPSSFTFTFNIVDFLSATLSGPFGNVTFSPGDTLSYTWTPSSNGGATITLTANTGSATDTESINVTVYEPVVTTIEADPDAIVRGNSSQLSWSVSGDASSASIDQGIGTVNFSGSTNVSPTSSTTYTLSASGLGGSDSDSVTLAVYQPPELAVTFPGTYDYGINRQMSVSTRYASSSITVQFTYLYFGGTTDTATINLTPNASSETGDSTEQGFTPQILWTDFGPETIDILVTATGLGGSLTSLRTETVNIDRLPDNINIPDRLEQPPATDPVFSPDEDTVLSDPIEISDIDIPVEIKADRPIQVRFDDTDPDIESNWKSLRSL